MLLHYGEMLDLTLRIAVHTPFIQKAYHAITNFVEYNQIIIKGRNIETT